MVSFGSVTGYVISRRLKPLPPAPSAMANKPPPLQLKFAVLGTKKVLPLTIENVACVFKTVVLYSENKRRFFGVFCLPSDLVNDPLSAAAWWVRNGTNRGWRVIIYYLDEVGETGMANELMPYSEPLSDSSLTVERVTPIFMSMSNWREVCTTVDYFGEEDVVTLCSMVPCARAGVICRQYRSNIDQRKQGAMYYVNVVPWASWRHLAGNLYRGEEDSAMETFKAQLPIPIDPTLTVENMMSATEGVEMPDSQSVFSGYLDMPVVSYNRVVGKGREELFTEFLSHHPYPTWHMVIKLLNAIRGWRARARHAQEIRRKYLTNVHSLYNLCVVHIVRNYDFHQHHLPQLLPHHIYMHVCSLLSWQQQELDM